MIRFFKTYKTNINENASTSKGIRNLLEDAEKESYNKLSQNLDDMSKKEEETDLILPCNYKLFYNIIQQDYRINNKFNYYEFIFNVVIDIEKFINNTKKVPINEKIHILIKTILNDVINNNLQLHVNGVLSISVIFNNNFIIQCPFKNKYDLDKDKLIKRIQDHVQSSSEYVLDKILFRIKFIENDSRPCIR